MSAVTTHRVSKQRQYAVEVSLSAAERAGLDELMRRRGLRKSAAGLRSLLHAAMADAGIPVQVQTTMEVAA